MQQDKGYRGGQITSPQAEIWPSEADVHPLTVSQPNKDLNYLQNLISICALSCDKLGQPHKEGGGGGGASLLLSDWHKLGLVVDVGGVFI